MPRRYVEMFAKGLSYNRRKRTKAMMRRLRDWTESIPAEWSTARSRGPGYDNWKTPVARGLINPPASTRHMQRQYIVNVLMAAVNMAKAKPDQHRQACVTAIVSYPDIFESEVCVFFDEAYYSSFAIRRKAHDYWQVLPKHRSLLRQFNLKLPQGFVEQGYYAKSRDETFDPPWEEEGEVWIYSEIK